MPAKEHELKIGDTTVKLTLAKDSTGAPIYQVSEALGDVNPNLSFTQTDWKGGHGQGDFLADDMFAIGQSIDTTSDGKIILGPKINPVGISGADLGANPVAIKWFNAITKLMVATSAKVFWYDGTNFVDKVTLAGVTHEGMTEYEKILYLARGTTGAYNYTADGVTFTATDLDDTTAEGFLVSPNPAGTADVLWKFKKPNEVSNTSNGRIEAAPASGVQWSSPNYVGDTSKNITRLMLSSDTLLAGREDDVYYLDSDGGIHPLYDGLRYNQSTNNFKYSTNWKGALYFSLLTGLGENYGGVSFATVGPLERLINISKTGTCVGLTSDRNFIYAAWKEGTNTIIYKGREIEREGLRWEWCPFIYLGTNACSTIQVAQHSETDRRLWFGYGNYLAYAKLGDTDGGEYAPSGFLRTSYFDAGTRDWDKLFQYLITETETCSANITIQPKYLKDTDTTASNLTPIIKNNGTLQSYLLNELSSKRIALQFDFVTNDSAVTPALTYFQARGILKPELIRIHDATYIIGDEPHFRTKELRNLLRTARASTSLIRFADLRYGESTSNLTYHWCIMEAGFPYEQEIRHEKKRQPEMGITVRLREVDFTVS